MKAIQLTFSLSLILSINALAQSEAKPEMSSGNNGQTVNQKETVKREPKAAMMEANTPQHQNNASELALPALAEPKRQKQESTPEN